MVYYIYPTTSFNVKCNSLNIGSCPWKCQNGLGHWTMRPDLSGEFANLKASHETSQQVQFNSIQFKNWIDDKSMIMAHKLNNRLQRMSNYQSVSSTFTSPANPVLRMKEGNHSRDHQAICAIPFFLR